MDAVTTSYESISREVYSRGGGGWGARVLPEADDVNIGVSGGWWMVVIVIVVLHGDDEVPLVGKTLTPLPTDCCYKYHYGDGSE